LHRRVSNGGAKCSDSLACPARFLIASSMPGNPSGLAVLHCSAGGRVLPDVLRRFAAAGASAVLPAGHLHFAGVCAASLGCSVPGLRGGCRCGGGDYLMEITPCTIREASSFVNQHHRHHRAPQGAIFAIALSSGDDVVGVAIVGRPVSRHAADGWTAELTRCCVVDGVKNGASKLMRAAWRAARALGYKRLITYTLPSEGGASLRGAGFRLLGTTPGGSWSSAGRPRVDRHPLQAKFRWECRDGS